MNIFSSKFYNRVSYICAALLVIYFCFAVVSDASADDRVVKLEQVAGVELNTADDIVAMGAVCLSANALSLVKQEDPYVLRQGVFWFNFLKGAIDNELVFDDLIIATHTVMQRAVDTGELNDSALLQLVRECTQIRYAAEALFGD